MPLDFSYDGQAVAAEFRVAVAAFPSWAELLGPTDVRRNVLLFVPVGVLVTATMARRRRRWAIPVAIAASGLISVVIESGQLFQLQRFASLSDVICNAGGGGGGALVALLAARPMRCFSARLQAELRSRHAYLAAVAIALALVAGSAWRVAADWAPVQRQLDRVIWSASDGLATQPWHAWLIRCAAVYAAMTMLLATAGAAPVPSRRRAWIAAGVVTVFAAVLQGMHLVLIGPPPNIAAVLVASLAAAIAAIVAPRLGQRRVQLPVAVLASATGLATLAGHFGWLATGGGSRLPFWGLYRHEFAWAYYATARRGAAMAGVAFMVAFYLSLTRNWRLRHRMLAGAGAATLLAIALESAKLLIGANSPNIAGLAEHIAAGTAGVLVFALLWHVLDRRVSLAAQTAHVGAERRSLVRR